jgi:hypothetical protein
MDIILLGLLSNVRLYKKCFCKEHEHIQQGRIKGAATRDCDLIR